MKGDQHARATKNIYKIKPSKLYKKGAAQSKYQSIGQALSSIKPSEPLTCLRLHTIAEATSFFLDNWAGRTLYSVKSNPSKIILEKLYAEGIREFDVASLKEVQLIAELFAGKPKNMYFMHPVKSREAIAASYFDYGIRDFSLDSIDELEKILQVTNNAQDLNLHVRLAIPNGYAAFDLSGKFGVDMEHAADLVSETRQHAKKLGICFHVGSQCMNPQSYKAALIMVRDILQHAEVKLDVLDIGGGFPSIYPDLIPPALISYMDVIKAEIKDLGLDNGCELWCEPGRALVAESTSIIARVELRKANFLYINDGTYGSLFDAGTPNFIFPTKAFRLNGKISKDLIPFSFYGPTCDSIDVMKGPFYLPEDIKEGDYIEIGQLGAYGTTMRTKFNGFHSDAQIEVDNNPLMSLFFSNQTTLKAVSNGN
jgi:ornithine decarboxylase